MHGGEGLLPSTKAHAGDSRDASCSSSTRTTCTPEGEKRGKLRGGDEGDRIPPSPPLGKDKKDAKGGRAVSVSRGEQEERKVLYPPPPPLHFTSRGVSEQLCVCVSVGPSVGPPARPLFLFSPSSVRWRHILLENTPAAYVQSRGAGKTEGKSYHLLLVGRKQYFSRRCLPPPPCLVWARRPFPKRAILATRHKKEEGRRRKTAAHFLTCMPDRPRHTQVFLLPFSSSLGSNTTIWQQKEGGMGCNTRLRPPLSSGPPPIFPLSCARAK